jgi:methionyl-tRNA synthetase
VPETVLPRSRKNEVASFVKSGLRDLSISRTSFKWGIPVPDDPEHIMYVWIDALTNYLTAVGYPDVDSEKFRTYWPADLHMVGKDILRFHAVYWPAFLMAAGVTPAKRVFAHGWWTNEGQKISKSLGNVIDPIEIVHEYGLDQVRYFLMREVPFGQDGDFSRKAVVHRINGDLANDLGNLAQRSLSMIAKNCSGAVPAPGEFTAADQAILDAAGTRLLEAVRLHMDRQEIHLALETIWRVVGDANSYFAAAEPWALKKSDPKRMATVLYVTAEVLRNIAILVQPVMPQSMARMLDQLGVGEGARTLAQIGPAGRLTAGTALPAPQGIFPRIQVQETA